MNYKSEYNGNFIRNFKFLILAMFMLFITVSANSQSYSELVTAGTQQLEDGNYDAAIANYAKALAADSLSSINEMIYVNMAQAYMGKGEKKRVEELYGKALEKYPRSKMLYALRAKFYLEQGKNEKALDDCNKVLSMDAGNEDALYLRAYILTEKKKYDLAREDYYALLAANPDNRKAQFALALLYAKEHKDNQALLLLDNLIEKTPDVPEYYLACSNIEQDNARYELALVYLDEGLKKCKERNALNLDKAEILVIMKRYDEAKRVLDALSVSGYYSPRMKQLYKKCK